MRDILSCLNDRYFSNLYELARIRCFDYVITYTNSVTRYRRADSTFLEMDDKIEELVLGLYDINVLKFGNFILKSSIPSPVYVDLRMTVSYPKLMDLMTNLMVHVMNSSREEPCQCICGVPYTALPIATLVSAKTGIAMVIRRKEVKGHGTGKVIEGVYREGDECIVIEDIVSSGSSILETVKDLENAGLRVKRAIVVLDREQGGIQNLEKRGIKVHVLVSFGRLLKILCKHDKITTKILSEVEKYISDNTITMVDDKLHVRDGVIKSRLTMPFGERAKQAKNKLSAKLFHIMDTKKSLLCLAADVTEASDLLRLATQVGPHICILKTHFDGVDNFSNETYRELLRIANNCNFLIMEDRKFSDIGNTVRLQYGKVKPWADLVTVHSISGESVLTALKSCVAGDEDKGCFLVAELSCEGNLISKEYTQATLRMAESHGDFVVGLVCQSPGLVKSPSMIQLTPGVRMGKGSDDLGQSYNEPESVVLERGADIAVVGRGITSSSDPEKVAISYKEKLWEAYRKRIA